MSLIIQYILQEKENKVLEEKKKEEAKKKKEIEEEMEASKLINIVRKAEEKMNEQRCLKLIDIVSYLNQ
jgi:hypothetical protein